jgi:hypothetical protein
MPCRRPVDRARRPRGAVFLLSIRKMRADSDFVHLLEVVANCPDLSPFSGRLLFWTDEGVSPAFSRSIRKGRWRILTLGQRRSSNRRSVVDEKKRSRGGRHSVENGLSRFFPFHNTIFFLLLPPREWIMTSPWRCETRASGLSGWGFPNVLLYYSLDTIFFVCLFME